MEDVSVSYWKNRYESQRIIVRVWTSASNPHLKGKDIGHVSIEIDKDHYLSLWPRDGLPEGFDLVKGIPHKFLSSYEQDCGKDAEDRPAEYTVCLFTLGKAEIIEEFKRLKENTIAWTAVPGLPWTVLAESCVSSVWRLLVAGGIKDLVSERQQQDIRREGSRVGSARSAVGTLFLPVHSSSSDRMGMADDAANIKQGGIYMTEMVLADLIKSPDYLVEVLIAAKKEDEVKVSHKNIARIDGDISDIVGPRKEQSFCVLL